MSTMSLKLKKNPAPPKQFQKSGPVVLPAMAKMLVPLHEFGTGLQVRKETMPQLHISSSTQTRNVWYILIQGEEQRQHRLISFTNFNAQLLYLLTTCTLHYNPRHVSSINMPIFRRTNCFITASGIVTLCKRLCSMPLRVTIPDAAIIQFVLLKMGMLMLEP